VGCLEQRFALQIGRRLEQRFALQIGRRLEQRFALQIGRRLEQRFALQIGRSPIIRSDKYSFRRALHDIATRSVALYDSRFTAPSAPLRAKDLVVDLLKNRISCFDLIEQIRVHLRILKSIGQETEPVNVRLKSLGRILDGRALVDLKGPIA